MKMNSKKWVGSLLLFVVLCAALAVGLTAYAGEPVTFSLSNNKVSEGSSSGTKVGDFQLTSPDTNPNYSLAGGQGDNGSFSVSGASLYTASAFDYESKSSYTVVVNVTADNEGIGQETFSISVSNVAPSASNASISVTEDGEASGTLPLSGDKTSVSFSIETQPTKGTVSLNSSSGAYTYTPNADENGSDSFTYSVTDGNSSDTGTISVTINPSNDAPIIQSDSVSLTCQEDGSAQSITLEASDSDGDSLTWTITTQGEHGTASAESSTVFYTPTDENYNGSDSFVATVSDGNGGSDSITVPVTITAVNDVPTFTVGSPVTVEEDCGAQTVANWMSAMSAGPADESAQTLTFAVTNNTNTALFSGAPAVDGNGTLTFTPAADANGSTTLTLSCTDSEGADSTGTQDFSITVTPVNDAPVCTASPEIDGTPHNGQTLSALSGSWNDDLDGSNASSWGYTYQWQSAAEEAGPWGDIEDASEEDYTLTSAENDLYVRVAVTCTDNDAAPKSAVAYSDTLLILNTAPSFTAGDSTSMSFIEDGDADSIVLSATDSDGDSLTWSITTQATKGTATITGETATYVPAANENGADSFVASVSDGNGGTDSITVYISIDAVNDAPSFTIGANQTADEDCGTQRVLNWPLAMSVGPDNEIDQTLIFTVEDNTNPSLFATAPAVSSVGTLTYTPADDANGTAEITLSVADSAGKSASATQSFTITINPVNDAPRNTQLPEVSGTLHNGQTVSASTGSWNDDADGDLATAMTYAYQWQSAAEASGSWGDISGATSASYTLTSAQNDQWIRVAVTCTDTDTEPLAATAYSTGAQVLNADPVITQGESTSLSLTEDGLAQSTTLDATDEDGDSLTWALTTQGTKGTASLTGSIASYTPSADENGDDSFVVTVSDGNGGSDAITVLVSIAAVNDIPSFTVGENQAVNEDCGAQTVANWMAQMSTGPANESDQTLIFTVDHNTNPTLFAAGPAVDDAGTLTYTPAANQHGNAVITLSAADSEGGNAAVAQDFTITVNPVNDAPVNTVIPSISGTFVVTGALTADAGTWNDDADGNAINPEDFTCVWQTAQDTDGTGVKQVGTGWSYQAATADAHLYIRVVVSIADTDATGTITAEANSGWYAISNTAPDIQEADPSITTAEDTEGSVSLSATDTDGDTVTWSVSEQASHGTASINADTGYVTYAPQDDYNGSDSFTISALDAHDGSDSVAVSVTISAVNDIPTFTVGENQAVNEDCGAQTVESWIGAMSAGPADESTQTLTFAVTNNTNESLFAAGPAVSGSGTLTFTPADDANGSATITLSVSDSAEATNPETQTFTITVAPVNDAPRNTVLPAISGTPHNGQTLSVSTGDWNDTADGDAATALHYAYQWQKSASESGPWSDLGGATADTYTLTIDENDLFIRAIVTCTDSDATPAYDTAYSAAVEVLNEAPVIGQGDTAAMEFAEDGAAQTLTLTAADADGDMLSWEITTPSIGNASIEDGVVTYQPNADENGTDSFTATVSDGNGATDSIAVTVTITSVNDIPTFSVGANQTVDEDCGAQTVVNWIPEMSVGPDNESEQTLIFTVSDITNAALFSAAPTVDANGTLTYTPAANANGSSEMTVSVKDSAGGENPATQSFTITVNAINDTPVKATDPSITGTFAAGNTLTANAGEWNDDIDDNAGTITYQYKWYFADDGTGTNEAMAGEGTTFPLTSAQSHQYVRIAVTVTNADSTGTQETGDTSPWYAISNTAPVITETAPTMTTDEDTPAALTLHATDADADTLTWSVSAAASHGTASIDAETGEISYSPVLNYHGTDAFTVSISDGMGGTNDVQVNVTVDAVNDIPVNTVIPSVTGTFAYGNTLTAHEGTWNDDADSNDGTIVYTYQWQCAVDGAGTDAANIATGNTYTLTAAESHQYVRVLVTATNEDTTGTTTEQASSLWTYIENTNPLITETEPAITTDEDTVQTLTLHATDVDTDTLTWSVTVPADRGTAVIGETTGEITYTPFADDNGSDSFDVTVSDAYGGTDVITVSVTLNPINDVPSFTVGADQTVVEDCGAQTVTDWITTMSTGPANESAQTLTYILSITSEDVADSAALFAVEPSVSPEGTLTYTPADNAYGTATLSIKVQDNGGGDTDTSAEQSFTISVTAANDKPTITGLAAVETPEDTPYVYSFTLVDVEDGPDDLTIAYASDNTALLEKSKMTLAGSGAERTLTLEPEENRSGTVNLTLSVADSQKGTTTKTITLTVTPVNDAPTISAVVDRSTDEDVSTGAIGFTIGDIDSDVSACTVTAVSGNSTLVPNDSTHIVTGGSGANRTVTILPAQDEYGTAEITLTVSDGSLTADTTFTLTVNAANDKPTISTVDPVTIDEDTNTGAIAFTVADVDNVIADLTVSAAANNTAMIPRSSIVLSAIEPDGSCAVTITPVANYNGTATITLTVKDTSGALSTSSFLLTVDPVNDPPTMTAISSQSTNEDVTKSINVYIGDIDTSTSLLMLTATASTNTDLLPLDSEHIVITGSTGTRTVKMVPVADQNGYTDVTLQVSDGGTQVATRTFRLTVNAVNDTPSFTAGEDVTVLEDCGAQTVSGWATNISTGAANEEEALTFAVTADIPAMFSVQPAIDAAGNLTFTPADNANGVGVITVSLSDAGGATSSSIDFHINITSVNDTPIAYDLTTGLDTDEDQQLKGSFSIYDPDKDTFTYELVSGSDHNVTTLTTASGGTVTLDAAAGTFIYVPYKDYFEGPDSFSYRVFDGTVYSNDAQVTIDLTGINDPPVTEDGTLTVDEDATDIAGSLAGLVTDVDNATLVYSIISTPNNGGTVTLDADTGAYTYSSAANYNGTERFTFRAYDGATYSNTATVTVTINAVNDAPVAQNENINLDEGQTLNGMLKATDIENDTITYSVVTEPASGTFTLVDAASGAFTFMPAEMTTEETVTAIAAYKAEDPSGDYTTATVTIVVRNVNDAPQVTEETTLTLTTSEDTAVNGSVAAYDPDGDTLIYTVLNNVNHGTLTSFDTVTGSFTYTPYTNYHGTDYFTFIATEDRAENALSTGIYMVSITVTSVNDNPVAYDLYYYTDKDTAVTITPVGYDPDWNSLTYSVESTPVYGSIVNNGNGTFTYTPNGTDIGVTDTILYKAADSYGGESENASIYVHIYGEGPGGGLNYIADRTIEENTSTDAIDISVTNITIQSVSITSSNTWLLNNDYANDIVITETDGNYSFVLTPNAYRTGRTVMTVRVTDTDNNTHVRTFVLTVTHVYYQPTAYSLERTIDEDTEMYEYVSGSDLNGDGISFANASSPSHGTLDFSANGTFHYIPDAGFSGDDSFTFTASNAQLTSEPATVTIHVANVPSAPTAENASFTTTEDVAITDGQLTGTADSGVTILYHLVENGTLGTAVVNEDGSFTYTPNENANGTDTFTFKTEGPITLFSSIAKVTVTITPENDQPVAVAKIVSTFEDQPMQGYLIGTDVDENDVLTYALVETDGALALGTVELDSVTGKYTYTPNPDANGTDIFYFKVNDSTVDSETAAITIDIEPQNDAPVVEDSAIVVGEDSSIEGALTSLYYDVDGDAQTFTTIQSPAKGTIEFNTDGTFTYTPYANQNGTDYFSYRTKDTSGLNSNVALVTVTITPENDAPTIDAAEVWTINEDSTAQMFYFTVDDIEDNPDDLTLSGIWDEEAIASVEFGGSGNNRWMKVTPVDSYQSLTTISITVSDTGTDNTLTGDVKTATTLVALTVLPVNDTPTVNEQKVNWIKIVENYTIDEDTSTSAISFTVDDEESGPEGVTVTASAVDKTLVPDSGITLTGAAGDRTITVTPAADQNGTTNIYIYASDGNTIRYAYFTLIVNPVNDAPVVTPPSDQTISEDGNTGDLYYSISDIDSSITGITVTATSDNESLVIPLDITLTGNARDRVVNVKPLADQNGDVTITLTADDGASINNTGSATFVVHVLAVDDTPTIETIEDQTIFEDSATAAIPVNVADIDDDLSALTLSAVSGNPSLIGTDGIVFTTDGETGQKYVTLTPIANANGSALITITVTDAAGKHKAISFTLNVTPVNDAPTITAITDQTILEDGKTAAITFNVADIDNDVLELTVTGSSDDTSVIPVSGFVFVGNGGERTVTITPLADQNGNIPVALTVKDPGGLTASSAFTVNITPVNDEPSFTGGEDQTVLEDCGLQTITGWATDISKGPANEDGQTLTFHLSNDNNDLFTSGGQPALDDSGVLTYTPADNMYGSATVTVYLTDDGGTANGGDDTSDNNADAVLYQDTFVITVKPVNDQPTFSALDADEDITVAEDSGAYSSAWADLDSMYLGPTINEKQTYNFSLALGTVNVVGNTELFSVAPAIDSQTGVISFTPAENANGTAEVTVVLKDDDGTENGGVDTSVEHTFTMTVTSVNDDPTFTLGDPIVVNEDSGLFMQTYATGITTGGGTDEETQALTFTLSADQKSLFAVQPAMTAEGVLTFTPADDQFGTTTVSISLDDETNTVDSSFTITIRAVNDHPTFTIGSNQTVWEDCGTQIITSWGTDMYTGADNESEQTLAFDVFSANSNLFTSTGLPAINAAGTLTFTPEADANGSSQITMNLIDNGGTLYGGIDTTFYGPALITVLPVNDQPSFSDLGAISVQEDSGAYSHTWVEDGSISVGPANESDQTYSFYMTEIEEDRETYGNTNLFSVQPTIDADTGVVSFTPAENASGSATYTVYMQDDGGTEREGVDTSVGHTLIITVGAVNDAPTYTLGGTVTVNEDSGAYQNDTYATGITTGGGTDETEQPLTFTLTVANEALFSTQPALTNTGKLTFTPAENANGSSLVTVSLSDGTNSIEKTFTITVLPVNDQPTFTDAGAITVDEDCGAKTVAWVSEYAVGPDNETQSHTFSLEEVSRTTYGNTSLFSAGPAINTDTGLVSFTPADNANGSITFNVYLQDNGGTDREGVDTSTAHTLTIIVNAVNDDPSCSLGSKVTVDEDSGEYQNAVFATNILPGGGTDEAGQNLTFTLTGYDATLFINPVTLSSDGKLVFTTAPDAHGSTTVSVALDDETNTVHYSFIIEIVSINDQPTFVKGGDQTVLEDCGAQTVTHWATELYSGADNESAQTLTFAATNDNNALFTSQPSLNAEGTLTYTPAADAFGTALVSVSLADNGGTANGGVDTSTIQTFTITVEPVNDQPSFTDQGNISIQEDSGAYNAGWVVGSSITVGPANEQQTYAFSMVEDTDERVTKGNANLFSVEPVIDAATGAISFTPAENANGSATYTVYLKDNDGTERGGLDTSTGHSLTITVTSINDMPTITLGETVTVNEDSGLYQNDTYATNITPGGGTDEASQTLTITLTPDEPSLFSSQPVLTTTGKLTFTPAADAYGTATVQVTVFDGTNTTYDSFEIIVNAVNDVPTFTAGSNQTVLEDCGPQTVVNWATDIGKGPVNENDQILTVVTQNDHPEWFTSGGLPTVSPLGVLTYTPKADAYGVVTVEVTFKDNGGTANGGDDTTDTVSFTITIQPVNDQPIFTENGNITVNEDSGDYTSAWVNEASIFIGPANEQQTYAFSMVEDADARVTSGNTSLFSTEPSIDPDTGAISFTPAENASGSAMFMVYLKDADGTANGGLDTSAAHSLTITVSAVNDAPTFTLGDTVTVDEDSGAFENATYATGITTGGGTDESTQELAFTLEADNKTLFSQQPAMTSEGKLTFTPAADAYGTTTVTASLSDGIDATQHTFIIVIRSVNDQPVFTDGGNITVLEDSGVYAQPWVETTSISGGPANETPDCTFSMVESEAERVTQGNTSLFSAEPAINPSTGAISFTPADNANGSATYTVYLKDTDGTDNGGVDTSAGHTLVITVSSVNDAPVFTLAGNVTVNEDSGAYQNDAFATSLSAGGGTDEADEELAFTVTAENTALFSTQPQITTNGKLTFTPAANAFGTTQVTVSLSDGAAHTEHSFTITINAVNDQPSFTDTGDITVLEDCGSYSQAWAEESSRFIGPANEDQTYQYIITKTVVTDGITLFTEGPSINPATGAISFTPAQDAFGSAQITVVLKDNDGTDNGGVDTSLEHTFTITVKSVNDRPVFEEIGDISVNEDSGDYSAAWIVYDTASAGPLNESQTYTFSMTVDDSSLVVSNGTELFTTQPSIDEHTGWISFTPEENISGSIMATVVLKDDDGTANGGMDTSIEHTFTIYVNAVNDAPVFTAGDDVSVGIGTGAYAAAAWATGISAGPEDEATQGLSFTVDVDKTQLFDVQPVISADGTLSFTPSSFFSGTAIISITLRDDGGIANGGVDTSAVQQVTINVVGSSDLVLTGAVLDAKTDTPIAGAAVRLLDHNGSELAAMTVGDDGIYRFAGLTVSSEDVYIVASAEGYPDNTVTTQISFATDPSGTITQDILLSKFNLVFTAEPSVILGDGKSEAVLTATITDDYGQPISGVLVTFACEAGTFKGGTSTAVTGSDGMCSVTFISEKLSGAEELSIPIQVRVKDDDKKLYGTAVIYERFAPGFVEGIVTDGDHDNKPVQGATVTVYKDFDGDGTIDFSETVITGANGRYKIAIPKGDVDYNISITKPVNVGGTETPVTFEQTVPVGNITGTGGESSKPSKSAIGIVTLQNQSGQSCSCGALIGAGLSMEIVGGGTHSNVTLNASSGVFSANNLSEGAYTLNVYYEYAGGERIIVGSRDIAISSSGETNVSEVLIDPYGVITDKKTGAVVSGALVKLYYANTSRNIASGKTPNTLVALPAVENFPPADNSNPQLSDGGGQYAFMVYPNADYYIIATKTGYETFNNSSTPIAVGDTIVNYNFAMTPVEEAADDDDDSDDDEEDTLSFFDTGIYVSTDQNRTLENSYLGCTITYGNKSDKVLPAATIVVGIPQGMTVQESNGGEVFTMLSVWHRTALLRLLPQWNESAFQHEILWRVSNLQPGEIRTIRIMLRTSAIGDEVSEASKTITARIISSELPTATADDTSFKTIIVASRTRASVQEAYFPTGTNGSFSPSGMITRGDAAFIFASIMGLDTENTQTAFTDVEPGSKYAGAIRAITDTGFMRGYTSTEFKPEQVMTRATFVTMIAKYLNIQRSYYIQPLLYHFTDIQNSSARSTIEEAYRYGLITPYADGTFRPNRVITREEAVVMLNRMLCRGALTNASETYVDVSVNNQNLGDIAAAVESYHSMTNPDGSETAVGWLDNQMIVADDEHIHTGG